MVDKTMTPRACIILAFAVLAALTVGPRREV